MSVDERARRSEAIAAAVAENAGFRAARTVAVYAPLGAEVDALPIARRAAERGARVVFPRVVAGARRLDFAACDPAALVPGPLGILQPPPAAPAVELAGIDCVVVPGIGFSADGHRLGRGGGYYDVTLAAMPRARRIAVAFDVQVVAALPREPHDAPLDALVTETRRLEFRRDPD
jgi:5-formyltetrahydrofolate cyclo-ligase